MDIRIEYCTSWNYKPKAASLAEALESKYGGQVKKVNLIPSSGGAFEVFVNDELLYSKLETGKFPSDEQITTSIEKK